VNYPQFEWVFLEINWIWRMTSWRTGSNVVEENAKSADILYSNRMRVHKTECVRLC